LNVEVEIYPWLSERLGGGDRATGILKWQVDMASPGSVGDLMAQLALEHDDFRRFAFDPESRTMSGELVVVFNSRLLDLAGGLDAELREGDRVAIIQALAGG
jgi:molybdopterin converting factor small subunit